MATTALPPDAMVIETADLGAARRLVLWMLRPDKVLSNGTCADSVYGDHWYVPIRLSLIDLVNEKIINTLEIHSPSQGSSEINPNFPIPFYVSDGFYHVPGINALNAENKGKPQILSLRDLTGEGVMGQFVLFEYEACGIAETAVLGYNRSAEAAVQYRTEVSWMAEAPSVVSWVQHTFGEKPSRPGFWKFTGHLGTEAIQ